ncbi:uncharacterized protein LOC125145648 isoform X1 [Tachysurus fulvidraco]|uniref:uncharacterized protein LOC125145648 isoform X1 n=1 Tax=Tachysurus fulvidraco TaxID=1234273 RepID=UPI001FEF17EF|nr:uncharacterized protein LOC125145648 isoform X1 [Tachysurus fulvidraco]
MFHLCHFPRHILINLLHTQAHRKHIASEVFSNDSGRKMDVTGLTYLLITTQIYNVLSPNTTTSLGCQPCPPDPKEVRCLPGNVTVQVKNNSPNTNTYVNMTCYTNLSTNMIDGFEWVKNQQKIPNNQSFLVQNITQKTNFTCTVLGPCGNFSSSIFEIGNNVLSANTTTSLGCQPCPPDPKEVRCLPGNVTVQVKNNSYRLISKQIYNVLSPNTTTSLGCQPCPPDPKEVQCLPGNVTVQVKNNSPNTNTYVNMTCYTNLSTNMIDGFEWVKNQQKIPDNQSFLVQKITQKTNFTCTVLTPCGNFSSSIFEIGSHGHQVLIVLLICGVGAVFIILTFGISMKIMLKRGEVQRQARRQQRQVMQSNESTATTISYW